MRRSAIVRPPADSFRSALSTHPLASTINVERARRQHAEYCDALAQSGAEVLTLPPEETLPDSCFVDDCAVIAEGHALLARPGAAARRTEPSLIEPILSKIVASVSTVEAPGTLDGGDVLRVGRRLIVGSSARTNCAGIECLRAFGSERDIDVVPVPVPRGTLHLQSLVTALGEDTIVGDRSLLGEPVFAGIRRRIAVPPSERPACNVVALEENVVMPAGCPRTASSIAALGYEVHEVDLSEFEKADGGATCLSLIVEGAGAGT